MATVLTQSPINAGESAVITAVLYDATESTLNKAAIQTLTMTITDGSGSVINSRSDSNILDANGGTLATDGTLTLVLSEEDNAYQGDGITENHTVVIKWTWSDGLSDFLGKNEWVVMVRQPPQSPSPVGNIPWLA